MCIGIRRRNPQKKMTKQVGPTSRSQVSLTGSEKYSAESELAKILIKFEMIEDEFLGGFRLVQRGDDGPDFRGRQNLKSPTELGRGHVLGISVPVETNCFQKLGEGWGEEEVEEEEMREIKVEERWREEEKMERGGEDGERRARRRSWRELK